MRRPNSTDSDGTFPPQEWDAGPDYNAGQAVEVWHETPAMDGAAIDQAGFDTMPYVVPLVPGNG